MRKALKSRQSKKGLSAFRVKKTRALTYTYARVRPKRISGTKRTDSKEKFDKKKVNER